MSSDHLGDQLAIKVENISKCYHIYDRPQDRLKQSLLPRMQRLCGLNAKTYFQEFWALNEICFNVRKGETVGIIGRNGSGKSTLLQMICGTLTPTNGSIETGGKVAALLELGSGFNPEFTGRENVYLAASIYGLTKQEVDTRFAAIAAFADIGDFIEQPVKTYSSGMYVRLAFAVIAHVDADILVVDEALAVGDAVFTQKCMRFIRKFKENGTLLFVSHDMNSVLNLCERAIWLHEGKVKQLGESKYVAEGYLQYTLQEVYGEEALLESFCDKKNLAINREIDDSSKEHAENGYGSEFGIALNLNEANGWKSGAGEITTIDFIDVYKTSRNVFEGGEKVLLRISAFAHKDFDKPILGFLVRDRLGQDLFGDNTLPFTGRNEVVIKAGESFYAEFVFKLPMLPNGQYVMMASLANGELNDHVQHHWLHDAVVIHVSSSKVRWGLVGIPFDAVTLSRSQ